MCFWFYSWVFQLDEEYFTILRFSDLKANWNCDHWSHKCWWVIFLTWKQDMCLSVSDFTLIIKPLVWISNSPKFDFEILVLNLKSCRSSSACLKNLWKRFCFLNVVGLREVSLQSQHSVLDCSLLICVSIGQQYWKWSLHLECELCNIKILCWKSNSESEVFFPEANDSF